MCRNKRKKSGGGRANANYVSFREWDTRYTIRNHLVTANRDH